MLKIVEMIHVNDGSYPNLQYSTNHRLLGGSIMMKIGRQLPLT